MKSIFTNVLLIFAFCSGAAHAAEFATKDHSLIEIESSALPQENVIWVHTTEEPFDVWASRQDIEPLFQELQSLKGVSAVTSRTKCILNKSIAQLANVKKLNSEETLIKMNRSTKFKAVTGKPNLYKGTRTIIPVILKIEFDLYLTFINEFASQSGTKAIETLNSGHKPALIEVFDQKNYNKGFIRLINLLSFSDLNGRQTIVEAKSITITNKIPGVGKIDYAAQGREKAIHLAEYLNSPEF